MLFQELPLDSLKAFHLVDRTHDDEQAMYQKRSVVIMILRYLILTITRLALGAVREEGDTPSFFSCSGCRQICPPFSATPFLQELRLGHGIKYQSVGTL